MILLNFMDKFTIERGELLVLISLCENQIKLDSQLAKMNPRSAKRCNREIEVLSEIKEKLNRFESISYDPK